MPKYTNSGNLEMITPQRRFTGERPTISDAQARAWWDALSNGAQNDLWVRVKLNEGRNLYYFTDEGTIVRAINEGDNLSDPDFLRGLMEKSMDGRLFTRFAQNDVPKQVITNPEEDFDVGIADQSWAVPTDQLEEEPKAPFFLKILAYPFSKSVREEFQTYWKEKEEYQIKNEDNKWRSRFGVTAIQGDILSEDYKEVMRNAQEKLQEEKRQRQLKEDQKEKEAYRQKQTQFKEVWDKDLSKMTIDEYMEYYVNLSNAHSSENRNIFEVVFSKHSTVDDLYDAMAGRMTFEMVRSSNVMTHALPNLKNELILMQLKPLQDAKAGLNEYLRKNLDQKLVKQVLESHDPGSDAYKKLTDKLQNLCDKKWHDWYFTKNGVIFDADKISNDMIKKAVQMKHMREGQQGMKELIQSVKQQSQPQQVQQVPAQQQMQQAQPEPSKAGPVSGM